MPVRINDQKRMVMETPGVQGMVLLYTVLSIQNLTLGLLEPSIVMQNMLRLNRCLLMYIKVISNELYLEKALLDLIDTISIQIDILTQKISLRELPLSCLIVF